MAELGGKNCRRGRTTFARGLFAGEIGMTAVYTPWTIRSIIPVRGCFAVWVELQRKLTAEPQIAALASLRLAGLLVAGTHFGECHNHLA